MVNPGAFRGSQKEFLMGERATYSAGMAGGYGVDALALIQRRYFKRYPVNLLHHEEPTAEHLAAVDDNSPEPEPEGGLYIPQVNPYGFHPPIPWIPYGMMMDSMLV